MSWEVQKGTSCRGLFDETSWPPLEVHWPHLTLPNKIPFWGPKSISYPVLKEKLRKNAFYTWKYHFFLKMETIGGYKRPPKFMNGHYELIDTWYIFWEAQKYTSWIPVIFFFGLKSYTKMVILVKEFFWSKLYLKDTKFL